MTNPLFPTIRYGKVKFRAISAIMDGSDGDELPDIVGARGTITFRASQPRILLAGSNPPVTLFQGAQTYTLDVDGYLVDSSGRRELSLISQDTPSNPPNWYYTASFSYADGYPSEPFPFTLSAGALVDLTTATPLANPAPGVYITKGDPGPAGPAGAAGTGTSTPVVPSAYQRGVNVSGAEFSHTAAQLPGTVGTDYFYPVAQDFTYLASRGHKTVRFPIRWERIQPDLNGPLNAAELGRITTVLANAAAANMVVNVEVHNYARFIRSTANGGATLTLNDGTLTNAHLIDLWTKLSAALKGKPGLWSYGLMNEPYSLPGNSGTWTAAKTLASFEVDNQLWAGNSATVARSTAVFHDGVAGIQVTATGLTAVPSRNFDANDGGNGTFTAADGPTLAAWVLVPAGTTGTNWQAKFLLQDMAYASSAGPTYFLTPGVWTQIMYSPGATLLGAHRQLSVQFNVDNPATPTAIVHVDTIQQGALTGVVTGSQVWQNASQAVLTAIRNAGDNTLITVPGYSYSSASQWVNNHPVPWITDPANNFLYEAHYYFDRNNSGAYSDTYAAENTDAVNRGYTSLAARALAEIGNFTNWCTTNNVKGFIGEFGWPNTGDTASWNAVGEALYAALDAKSMSATFWATGSAWGSTYLLSVYTGSPLSLATSIAATTEAHLTPAPTGGSTGGSAGTVYAFTNLDTWLVTHNLGRNPYSVMVIANGREYLTDVEFISITQCVIKFAAPISGTATIT